MLTFIETKLFTDLVQNYFTDEEYSELQQAIAEHPEAGAVIRGSGGVRKLRWRGSGRGKSETHTIPATILKKIKEELDGDD